LNKESLPTGYSEGELHIRSRLISRGYHNHDSSAFSIDPDGVIIFQTGDVYERIPSVDGDRLLWKGRKEDYIQMTSGEVIDPRIHQSTLDSCQAIARSCLIGNNFLQGTAQHICAIVQPVSNDTSEIFKAIASVNRNLIPSLRIAWSRTLILEEGESIPINRKGLIFRKKLQSLYGDRLANLQSQSSTATAHLPIPQPEAPLRLRAGQISQIVRDAVSTALGLSTSVIDANATSTFAEVTSLLP
jgi:long-subunit acyl-CoA synthetase (AMP-forming)